MVGRRTKCPALKRSRGPLLLGELALQGAELLRELPGGALGEALRVLEARHLKGAPGLFPARDWRTSARVLNIASDLPPQNRAVALVDIPLY